MENEPQPRTTRARDCASETRGRRLHNGEREVLMRGGTHTRDNTTRDTPELERLESERMNYTIEATGQTGWMAYRYQYKAGVHDYFGYTETEEEALSIIKEAGL